MCIVSRVKHNSRHPSKKIVGPLSTQEIAVRELFWIKKAQHQGTNDTKFLHDKEQLNLSNDEGVLECQGRIQGDFPVYLLDSELYTAKVVQRAHIVTLHGGVGLTMAKVREKFWVPRLRKLAKGVLKSCWGCKRFRAIPGQSPPPGLLPRERTEL